MSDGFLGRWSRRKLDAKEGKPLPPEPADQVDVTPQPPVATPVAAARVQTIEIPPELPPPTLEDVKALTAESDFSRFAARDVAPQVKNAALKKLFSDPRYNVMDGLDVYIDDYSKPDPLPTHVARELAGAAFLKLFDEPVPEVREAADDPRRDSVAQSLTDSPAVPAPDADADLRLQQDDAAGRADPGPGAA
jgi:hypothetical protein